MESHASPGTRSLVRRSLNSLIAVPTPVIFIAAAAIAGVLLWRRGALQDVAVAIRNADPWQLGAILAAYSGSIFVLGMRWHVLVRMVEGSPAWTASSEVFLTSVIVNYAAPIGLAVPTRAALSVRDLGLTPLQSGAVVAWEAGLDFAALALVSAAWIAGSGAAALQPMPVDPRAVAAAATACAGAVAATMLIVRASAHGPRLAGAIRRTLAFPGQNPLLAAIAVVLTGAFWGTQIGVMALLLEVVGVSPAPSLLLGLMGLPILIGMLSPVPGGAGVREGLMAAAARLEGEPVGPVVLAAVAYRLALFVVTPIVWGAVRFTRSHAARR